MNVDRGPASKIEPCAVESARLAQNSNLLIAGYFLHLAVPALLLVDVLTAWRKGLITLQPRSLVAAVAGLSALWLVAGLGLWFVGRHRQGFAQRIATFLLGIYTVYGMLILIEVLLPLIAPPPSIPGLQPPGSRLVFSVYPGQFLGLQGTKIWSINHLGMRGPMPPKPGAAYRILTIGGSTTACTMLGDSEEWPHLLMEDLNDRRKDHPVWVGNAGINGANAVDHLTLMQSLPGLIPADLVVFLVGINDLATTLAYQGDSTQAVLERSAGLRRDVPPGAMEKSRFPIYQHLRFTLLMRDAVRNLETRFGRSGRKNLAAKPAVVSAAAQQAAQTPKSEAVALQGNREMEGRERRAAAPVVPLPDLRTGLKEYRSRIVSLANRCRSLQLRCLFMTQPFLYRSTLSTTEQRLLWFGWVGFWEHPRGFASPADLAQAMDAYNQALLDVCRRNGLECYDLARDIPKDTSAFFDDVHFNEGGARLVAWNLTQYLLSKPPLR